MKLHLKLHQRWLRDWQENKKKKGGEKKKMCLISRRRAVSLNWIKLHGGLSRDDNTTPLYSLSSSDTNTKSLQELVWAVIWTLLINRVNFGWDEGDIRGLNFGLTRPLICKPLICFCPSLPANQRRPAWLHINLRFTTSPHTHLYEILNAAAASKVEIL